MFETLLQLHVCFEITVIHLPVDTTARNFCAGVSTYFKGGLLRLKSEDFHAFQSPGFED